MKLYVNGAQVGASELNENKLYRAVLISLFTWGRARDGDDTDSKWGWWGDTLATGGDQIGSRLYLCVRRPLTDSTIRQAEEYAQQALQWMLDDGVASKVEVHAERPEGDPNRLDMAVTITAGKDYELVFTELNNVE